MNPLPDKTPKLAELRRQAMALPLDPGVYIMKDARGDIIYIGKAKALKNRVSQYFGSDTNHTEKAGGRRRVRIVLPQKGEQAQLSICRAMICGA